MAKKRKNFMEGWSGGPVKEASHLQEIHDIMDELVSDPVMKAMLDSMPEEGRICFTRMFELAMMGVKPEEYKAFYQMFGLIGSSFESEEASGMSFPGRKKRVDIKENPKMENASDKTLVLKIQMKGVVKPPMWREVEVPADYDFLKLHDVIQMVTGLENSHLWQFGIDAYDDSLIIGVPMDDYGYGLDFLTDDAGETPLTRYLHEKGDRLEYVYDFGDYWVFTVEVKKIIDRKCEFPVCVKFKSDLNALEDFGGPWNYVEAREDLADWDTLGKEERKERMEMHCFDSENDYIDFLESHKICIDEVNARLKK